MELRGPSLMAWMDALPPLDPQDVEDAHASISSAMQGIDS